MDTGNNQWTTKVAAEYFKIPETTNITSKILLSLPKNQRYVFKLTYNSMEYILKGFTFKIPHRQLDILKYQAKLFKVFQKIQLVYSEFYLTKAASLFSPHFCKPLSIDHKLKIEPDESQEQSTYVIEILQEYGGQPLDQIAKGPVPPPLTYIFNLMYQSAHALAFLHHTGTVHMDLKPANIVYDKTLDTVRMIDFGSSTSATQSVKLHKGTINIEGKLRDLTPEFAAPEVLRRYKDPSLDVQLVLSSVDIYCWGMAFYSILMKKTSKELLSDVETFKLKENKEYKEYLNKIEKEFVNYKLKGKEETEMKEWVQKTILKSISFLPEERPRFDNILSSLTETLREILPYEKRAQEERRKLLEKIAGSNLKVEAVASSSAVVYKTEGVTEEKCKKLMKEVSELRNKLQTSIDELNKSKVRNNQLEEYIHGIQKQYEENQKLISQLTKEREFQDLKIAELMFKEKALEENKTVSPSKMVTLKKESKKALAKNLIKIGKEEEKKSPEEVRKQVYDELCKIMGNNAQNIELRDLIMTENHISLLGEKKDSYMIPLEEIAAIAAGLVYSDNMTTISFQRDEGIKLIAKAIGVNYNLTQLTELFLMGDEFGLEGAKALARAFTSNQNIRLEFLQLSTLHE